MKKKLAVVTGGGSGIGRCTALSLAQKGVHVIVIGRQLEALQGTQLYMSDDIITPLVADLSEPEEWEQISRKLPEGSIDYLVHCAAILGPFANMKHVSYKHWRETICINAEAPLFLTQALIPRLSQGRVLFVSSDAADIPLGHLGSYCGSKVLLRMIKRVLKVDLSRENIVFSSISPGAVDTRMQTVLRQQSEEDLPVVGIFKKLAEDGILISPSKVADYIVWLLLEADRGIFSSIDEWNFQIKEHLDLWSKNRIRDHDE